MKQNVSKRICLFVLGMSLILSLSFFINLTIDVRYKKIITASLNEDNPVYHNLKTSKISEPIRISNNWSAAKIAGICTGNGIFSDPYIIKDLVIDGGGSRSCILIESSTAHFRIINCTVFNSGGPVQLLHGGIHLSFVSNGQLINNSCYSNTNGILLATRCTDNIVMGNNLTNNVVGIDTFFECSSNTFSFNYLVDNNEGISLDYDCHNNNILDNIAIYNNVGISVASSSTNIRRNMCNNNIQGINIIECNENTISENTASFNTYSGIRLSVSYGNTISGNTLNNNTIAGIYLSYNNWGNTISGNTASNNEYGIYFISSDDNTISGNNLGGNTVCIYEDGCQGNEFSNNLGCTYPPPPSQPNNGIPPMLILNTFLVIGGISGVLIIAVIEIKRIRKRK